VDFQNGQVRVCGNQNWIFTDYKRQIIYIQYIIWLISIAKTFTLFNVLSRPEVPSSLINKNMAEEEKVHEVVEKHILNVVTAAKKASR
jgi:hypothetical protein